MPKNILIIVAHPDDETIAMGGTIKKHSLEGDIIKVISLTNGEDSRKNFKPNQIDIRKKAAIKSSKILGFEWLSMHNFKDNSLDSYPLLEIIQTLEEDKIKFYPDLIYTHCSKDLNIDHRITLEAVLTVFRPVPNEKSVEIRLFEVASSTDYGSELVTGQFLPNLFIDVSKFWKFKKSALNCYKKELRKYPHSRSLDGIENLSKLRGNQIGRLQSEAFQILRKIL